MQRVSDLLFVCAEGGVLSDFLAVFEVLVDVLEAVDLEDLDLRAGDVGADVAPDESFLGEPHLRFETSSCLSG